MSCLAQIEATIAAAGERQEKVAHMKQEKKKVIRDRLKAVVPRAWRWTLGVRNHSTIVLKILVADVDLIAMIEENRGNGFRSMTDCSISGKSDMGCYFSGETLDVMKKIQDALNTGNYDNSDTQSDYFDVGHYVDICIGTWDKEFVFTSRRET